jgi:rod shape determining protein RodA
MDIRPTNQPINKLGKRFDIKTFVICLLLTVFGLVSVYSATMVSDMSNNFERQTISAIIGLVALLVTSTIPNRYVKSIAIPSYIITNALLVVVLFLGAINYGTRGWIVLFGQSFQPAELAKISLILVFAKHLSKRGNNVNNIWDFSKLFGYFIIPFILINLQPDFGTSLVFVALFFGILYWGGFDGFYLTAIIAAGFIFIASLASLKITIIVGVLIAVILLFFRKRLLTYFITIAVVISISFAAPLLYNSLEVHQKERINVFLNLDADPQGSGYNVMQSMLAVGSGGITGKGFQNGTLTQLRYIPMQWTDFIFSVPAEEFGMVGAIIILMFLFALIFRAINVAFNAKEIFNSVISIGAGIVFLFHIIVNIGMVLGVFPVMGIPLPFMSYGGTALITNMVMVGLIMNAYRASNK